MVFAHQGKAQWQGPPRAPWCRLGLGFNVFCTLGLGLGSSIGRLVPHIRQNTELSMKAFPHPQTWRARALGVGRLMRAVRVRVMVSYLIALASGTGLGLGMGCGKWPVRVVVRVGHPVSDLVALFRQFCCLFHCVFGNANDDDY